MGLWRREMRLTSGVGRLGAVSGLGASYSPANLGSALVAWAEPRSGFIFQDAAGTPTTADDQVVGLMIDRRDTFASQTHPTWANASGASKPLRKVGGTRIEFDGVDDLLLSSDLGLAATAASLFFAVTLLEAPATYDPVAIGGTTASLRLVTKTGGTNWGTWGGTDQDAGSALVNGGTYVLGMACTAGRAGVFYKNGVADGTFASTGGDGAGDWLLRLAAEPGQSRFLAVRLAGLVVTNTQLSAAQALDLSRYLAAL